MCEESELSELSPGPHSCCRVVVSSNFVKFDKIRPFGAFWGYSRRYGFFSNLRSLWVRCGNVRTKLTKYTKSGFGRHFCRDGDDLPFYDRPGVGVSLVVKTAQSRERLGAPWLRDDFCSPQAHPCCGQTCSLTLISLYRWWAAVRGQKAPVQGQAEAP